MSRLLFFISLFLLLGFEICNVYFIMPMPGSQNMSSIDAAYFLYKWRWLFRIFFSACIVYGLLRSTWKRKWIPYLLMGLTAVGCYILNFKMAADHIFYQPKKLLMVATPANKVDLQRLVIGVVKNGIAKAYPIQYLGFHHLVADSLGGKPIIVTYCTVCRTGRIFEPVVAGKYEKFRLVGMDHFNAMFEDVSTKSWWRQVTGEAIAGKLKGQKLPEIFSTQTSLYEWLKLNPASLIMQADPSYISSYDSTFNYENGKSKSKLTGTDSLSWKDKSWVLGVKAGMNSKAYDWNKIKTQKLIRDKIGNINVFLILANDNKSFFAFENLPGNPPTSIVNDTLFVNGNKYKLDGSSINNSAPLKRLPVSQEFWHSWRTFNPGTEVY